MLLSSFAIKCCSLSQIQKFPTENQPATIHTETMCRPLNSSLPQGQLFQRDVAMQHKAPPSLSFESPQPTMMGPLTLPPLRPAPRPCRTMEINEAIMLPSFSFDDMMDEDDDCKKMLLPRFDHAFDDYEMDTFE